MSSLSSHLSPTHTSSMRQRRRSILQHQAQEARMDKEEFQQRQFIAKGQSKASNMLAKLYLILMLLLVVIVMVLLMVFYGKDLLYNSTTKEEQQVQVITMLALYPPHISPKHDFRHDLRLSKRWIKTTRQNEPTRRAIQNIMTLGQALRRVWSKKKISTLVLQTWELEDVTKFVTNHEKTCGVPNLEHVYQLASDSLQEKSMSPMQQDLILWCLLASGRINGFVPYEYSENPTYLREGSLALSALWKLKRQQEDSIQVVAVENSKQDAILSNSLLLLMTRENSHLQQSARVVLDWIVETISSAAEYQPETNSYRNELSRLLHQQLSNHDGIFLSCQQDNNHNGDHHLKQGKLLARHCDGDEDCCNVIVPNVVGPQQRQAPQQEQYNRELSQVDLETQQDADSIDTLLRH